MNYFYIKLVHCNNYLVRTVVTKWPGALANYAPMHFVPVVYGLKWLVSDFIEYEVNEDSNVACVEITPSKETVTAVTSTKKSGKQSKKARKRRLQEEQEEEEGEKRLTGKEVRRMRAGNKKMSLYM